MSPMTAPTEVLIIVDVQNDFCPGGSLAVPQGLEVIAPLNAYLTRAVAHGMTIFASRDWHPAQTQHFAEHGGTWPVHCVQGQVGAEFHPALRLSDFRQNVQIVTKGDGAADDGYSAFEGRVADGRPLEQALRDAGVWRLYVGGLATDYCVLQTVLDGRARHFDVVWLRDASRPVEVARGDGKRAEVAMLEAGARACVLEQFPLPRLLAAVASSEMADRHG